MASLFEHLFDSLPFTALDKTIARQVGCGISDPNKLPTKFPPGVLGHAVYLPPIDGLIPWSPIMPDKPSGDPEPNLARIWGLEPSTDPAMFGRVWCRVRENAFGKQLVCERIRFGTLVDGGAVKPHIRVTLAGHDLELPLSQAYLHQQWGFDEFSLQDHESRSWPLGCVIDMSYLRVFVYEVDAATYDVRPYDPGADPVDGAMLKRAARAAEIFFPVGKTHRIDLPPDDLLEKLPDIYRGNFMPKPGEASITGVVPSDNKVAVGPIRILVMVSLTLNREKSNFEPGGIIGMGRAHPHIIVKASVPLDKICADVDVVRPEVSDAETCMCGEMNKTINPIMVSDANQGAEIPSPAWVPTLPWWSNMFAYYATHAAGGGPKANRPPGDVSLTGQRMHMVVSSRTEARVSVGSVYRTTFLVDPPDALESCRSVSDVVALDSDPLVPGLIDVVKLARQGEFDNIHMAPTMWLDANAVGHLYAPVPDAITDRDALRMDEVVMAPFCAHDCFHMHWRWGNAAPGGAFFVFGWGPDGPYTVPGATMVPPNQDVFLTITSRHSCIYSVEVSAPIPVGEPQFIFHHGMAYGVDATAFRPGWGALVSNPLLWMGRAGTLGSPGAEFWKSGIVASLVDPVSSWASLYWHLRYALKKVDGKWRAIERTIVFDLDALRAL